MRWLMRLKLCLSVFIVFVWLYYRLLTVWPQWLHMCISVLIHNSVVEVLEKHGLQKPISYVKNSQNSEEEAHQLMVKLCRHTGRKYELRKTHTHAQTNTEMPTHEHTERLCVCVQKPSGEWDGVEKSTAGPAWHAAECLHLSKTRDMPPGIARDYQICTKMSIIHTLSCVFPPPEPLNSEFDNAAY